MNTVLAAGRALVRRPWELLIAHPWWRRAVTSQTYLAVRMTLSDPPWEGAKLTWRRRLNLYVQRIEHRMGRTKLWSKPCKLTVEATNICNLRCPGCFTGTNQDGRARSHMSLELFNQLMDELGPYLLEVEFYKPEGVDRQTPHTRDEVYVVASGSGTFVSGGNRQPFETGEVLFAAAGVDHRFEEFTPDFATWVFFYGPEGGEK